MKLLKYIPALGLMAALMSSCESDLEKTIYDESKVTPAVISGIQENYVLDASKGNENALSVTWSKPDMTYQASVTSLLQMDLKEKKFTKPITLASSNTEAAYSATVSDFNKQIMSLLKNHGIEYAEGNVELSFRVGSYISTTIDTIFSEVANTIVTPYVGEAVYPSIVVVGDYCGWEFNDIQFIYSANSDDNYSGMIYFNGKAAKGWKFTKEPAWDKGEWGANGTIEPEAPKTTLVTSGGVDIKAYSKNSYWVEFNTTTGVLKMSQGYNSWGVTGDFNAWGEAQPDTKMTLGKDNTGTYLVTTVEFQADKVKWKIRPEDKWENDRGPGNTVFEGDVEDNGDGNFKVSQGAGNYEIKWYFNKVQQKIVVTKK